MPSILICGERSGIVREAFRACGWSAWSCDLEPAEDGSKFHYQCDMFEMLPGGRIYHTMLLEDQAPKWDIIGFHPDCTYMSVSGLHWNKRRPERAALTEAALKQVERIFALPLPRIYLENPISCISTRIRKSDQIVQPYMFGEDASKATCFWLRGLPLLDIPPEDEWCLPRIVTYNGKQVKRWANQTDSGQNKLPPSADRWMERARALILALLAPKPQHGATSILLDAKN